MLASWAVLHDESMKKWWAGGCEWDYEMSLPYDSNIVCCDICAGRYRPGRHHMTPYLIRWHMELHPLHPTTIWPRDSTNSFAWTLSPLLFWDGCPVHQNPRKGTKSTYRWKMGGWCSHGGIFVNGWETTCLDSEECTQISSSIKCLSIRDIDQRLVKLLVILV